MEKKTQKFGVVCTLSARNSAQNSAITITKCFLPQTTNKKLKEQKTTSAIIKRTLPTCTCTRDAANIVGPGVGVLQHSLTAVGLGAFRNANFKNPFSVCFCQLSSMKSEVL